MNMNILYIDFVQYCPFKKNQIKLIGNQNLLPLSQFLPVKCLVHRQRSPSGVPPFKQSIPERSGRYQRHQNLESVLVRIHIVFDFAQEKCIYHKNLFLSFAVFKQQKFQLMSLCFLLKKIKRIEVLILSLSLHPPPQTLL